VENRSLFVILMRVDRESHTLDGSVEPEIPRAHIPAADFVIIKDPWAVRLNPQDLPGTCQRGGVWYAYLLFLDRNYFQAEFLRICVSFCQCNAMKALWKEICLFLRIHPAISFVKPYLTIELADS
jgi:hypothetical protein